MNQGKVYDEASFAEFDVKTRRQRILILINGSFLISVSSLFPYVDEMATSLYRTLALVLGILCVLFYAVSKIWFPDRWEQYNPQTGMYEVWERPGVYVRFKFLSMFTFFFLGMLLFSVIRLIVAYLTDIPGIYFFFLTLFVFLWAGYNVNQKRKSGKGDGNFIYIPYLTSIAVVVMGSFIWAIVSIGTGTWYGIVIMVVGLLLVMFGFPGTVAYIAIKASKPKN